MGSVMNVNFGARERGHLEQSCGIKDHFWPRELIDIDPFM